MRFLGSLLSHTKATVDHTCGGFPGFSTTMKVGASSSDGMQGLQTVPPATNLCICMGGGGSGIMKCDLGHFFLDKKCEKPLDVVFVLDSSEKVGTENWKKIVNATIDMASEFDIKTARFAVVQYTNFPETPIKLISFKDDKSFGETLKKVFYKTGGKRTDLALNSTLGVFKAASPRLGSKVLSEKYICILANIEKRLRRGRFTFANDIISPNEPLPHASSRSIVSPCSVFLYSAVLVQ